MDRVRSRHHTTSKQPPPGFGQLLRSCALVEHLGGWQREENEGFEFVGGWEFEEDEFAGEFLDCEGGFGWRG